MSHAPPPRPPALGAPITLNSVPFVPQSDGTWLCPLPAGTETVNGSPYRLELRLIPVGPAPPTPVPPPPPPLPPPPNPTPPPVPSGQVLGVYSPFGVKETTGTAGTVVAIFGMGFGTAAGSVRIAGLPAAVFSWSDLSIVATLPGPPAGTTAVSGPVTVELGGGSVLTSPFSFTIGR